MLRKTLVTLIPLAFLSIASASMSFGSKGKPLQVTLNEQPDAANAGLQGSTGVALVQEEIGQVHIVVDLGGAELPEGSVLEGWVVDAGLLGGPGTTSVSDDDELYGTPFENAAFDALVDDAPYALSTGMLQKRGNEYSVNFKISNNLTPFDAVVVTLESDGNGMNYDPRPGSIVVAGPIIR